MKVSTSILCLSLVCLLALTASPTFADEAPAEAPVPVVDTDDVAKEALAAFKDEYKAKGLRGDDKIAARVYAAKRLAAVQHPDIVKQLTKLARLGGKGNADVRTAAVQYLGYQNALPGLAGKSVVAAMQRNDKDEVLLLNGLQSIQALGFQGASEYVGDLIKHPSYSVKKAALKAIAELGDMRHVEVVFAMLKEIKAAEGDSWDGVSVTVDTGTAGDGDQRAAEAEGQAQLAKNKAKAGRGGARSQRDMAPIVSEVLKKLTGMEFKSGKEAKAWFEANAKNIEKTIAELEALAKKQLQDAR